MYLTIITNHHILRDPLRAELSLLLHPIQAFLRPRMPEVW